MRFPPPTPILLLLAWLGGCGGNGDENAACMPQAPERLTDGLVDHACLHTEAGPFAAIKAAATSAAIAEVPEVRNTHTAYTITLPAGQAGVVRLRPRSAGVYAVLLSAPIPVAVRAPEEPAASCQLEERDGHGCPKLVVGRSYRLARLRDYAVTLGPADAPSVMLVLEQVSETDEP